MSIKNLKIKSFGSSSFLLLALLVSVASAALDSATSADDADKKSSRKSQSSQPPAVVMPASPIGPNASEGSASPPQPKQASELRLVPKSNSKGDSKEEADAPTDKSLNKSASKKIGDEIAVEKSDGSKVGHDSKPKKKLPKDRDDNEDAECPGSEGSQVPGGNTEEDVPLEQDEHPFDAPAAKTDASATEPNRLRATPVKGSSVKGSSVKGSSVKGKSIKDIPDEEPAVGDTHLQRRINQCLAYYFAHQESLVKRSPWAVMHTILPFGVETEISAGNRSVNAIGWMCYNGVCKTQRMFQPTQSGFRTNVGPGVQGHEGQFLAILAQSSVPRDFPILVGKTRYKVNDLIRYEMATCRENSELTFKLIALSHYLSARQVWRDDRGQSWNLEKLVREELDQPVVGAACGGTHRLMGLSYALMMRRRYNEPVVGHWARAEAYIQDFVQYAWTLQNPDGSFSTDWFEGRANEPDLERKVQTSGHILEWLIFTLPPEELDDPRVAKSLEFLLSQVYDHRDKAWPIGPRGHSLRAISLYNQRVFGAPTGGLKNYLAQAGYAISLR